VSRRGALLAALALAAVPPVPAQSYTAAQLDCAGFAESAHSDIETETGGRIRRAVAERAGRWSVRARDTAGGLALESWYDSLAVRHGSADSLTAPDTDGLIGGRYRGLLGRSGEYRRLATPFVPDEVAEAADAAGFADDLLPRLPPAPLAVGARWTDGAGLEIERLADSAGASGPLRRYALVRRTRVLEAVPAGDTVPIPLRQASVDEARVVWDPARGLLRRTRETVTEATIPAGGRIRAPVRTRVVQRADLLRLDPADSCR
jgi:hypothetical protein